MKKIINGRGTGKSGNLMLLAKEENAIIVCSNPSAMAHKAHAYGFVGIEFISYSQFTDGDYDKARKVFIDELEDYVRSLGNNFHGYTLTND